LNTSSEDTSDSWETGIFPTFDSLGIDEPLELSLVKVGSVDFESGELVDGGLSEAGEFDNPVVLVNSI
jgi:hypothetical protein